MCDDSAPMLPRERSQHQQHQRVCLTLPPDQPFPIPNLQSPTALHMIAKRSSTLSSTFHPQFHSDWAAVESYLTHFVVLTADLFRLSVSHS